MKNRIKIWIDRLEGFLASRLWAAISAAAIWNSQLGEDSRTLPSATGRGAGGTSSTTQGSPDIGIVLYMTSEKVDFDALQLRSGDELVVRHTFSFSNGQELTLTTSLVLVQDTDGQRLESGVPTLTGHGSLS